MRRPIPIKSFCFRGDFSIFSVQSSRPLSPPFHPHSALQQILARCQFNVLVFRSWLPASHLGVQRRPASDRSGMSMSGSRRVASISIASRFGVRGKDRFFGSDHGATDSFTSRSRSAVAPRCCVIEIAVWECAASTLCPFDLRMKASRV